MKLEPLFYVKENKLFKIEGDSSVDLSSLEKIELSWGQVEFEEESYNEELLAQLRDELKNLEIQKKIAVIVPKVDKPLESDEQKEAFINCFNHCARRIKDCVNVAGFELPPDICKFGFDEDSIAQNFMDTLAIKHAQYVYFAHSENALPSSIVRY